jgi:hypothetical protein
MLGTVLWLASTGIAQQPSSFSPVLTPSDDAATTAKPTAKPTARATAKPTARAKATGKGASSVAPGFVGSGPAVSDNLNIQIDVPDGPEKSKKPSPGTRLGKSRSGADHSSTRPGGSTVGSSPRGKGWWSPGASRRGPDEPDASASRDRSRRSRGDARDRTADLTSQSRANLR